MFDTPIKNYPGNKGVNGFYQAIINLMPVHDIYIELFLGSGQIFCRKEPAAINICNDIDPKIFHSWKQLCPQVGHDSQKCLSGPEESPASCDRQNRLLQLCRHHRHSQLSLPAGNVVAFTNTWAGKIIVDYEGMNEKILFYADPPYLEYTRSCSRDLYDYQLSEKGHMQLLDLAVSSKHYWIISCYDNKLYQDKLKGWGKTTVNVRTRRSTKVETIYYNFPNPKKVHDYKFIGKDFTDRQRIKRKVARWVFKFENLPDLERELIYQQLQSKFAALSL